MEIEEVYRKEFGLSAVMGRGFPLFNMITTSADLLDCI
jgi:hypothetical protein